MYYWREKGENKDDTGLDVYHWYGPGVVCATEPPTNLDLSLLDRCYWVVHGSALFWCTHEQLRPETVDERDNRESLTGTHMPAPNLDTIRGMLSKMTGPVRFVDLKGKERPYIHSPPPPAQHQQVYEPTEAEQRAAAHAARQHHQATASIPILPEDTPVVDETAPEPSVAATKETTSRQSGPADDPMGTGLPDWLQPFEPEETDADGDPIGASQEATEALLKYINRNAWRPAKRVTSNPKKTCPIVFVLKWKNGAAHARVCTKLLHKESSTMSRIGRSFIFFVLVHKRWKAFAADAADAFLQSMNVEDLGIDIFTDPVGDVRKRLQRLMNLAEDEVLKMLKSGFGDVRAPRLWCDKAARDLCQFGFARHPLDRCVFMSFNGGDLPKSVSEGMERLDGILGLHVDDFIGGGEGMSRVAVEGWNHLPVGVPNFASRVKWLKNEAGIG